MIKDVSIDNFLRGCNYKYNNLEDFLYRMIFFEDEDLELAVNRTFYLSLLSLKNIGWTREDEENRSLMVAVDDICNYFLYPEGAEYISHIWALPMDYREWIKDEPEDKYPQFDDDIYRYMSKYGRGPEPQKWTQSGSLEEYFKKYRYLLEYWDNVRLDIYPELFDNRFALIKNGKFKHHLITGKKEDNGTMSLKIWTDKIFVEEKQYEFNFGSREELEKFLVDNGIVIDSSISNDFFLDEEPYLSKFRYKFDNDGYVPFCNVHIPFKQEIWDKLNSDQKEESTEDGK
jgi:hypothetical protein